MRDVRRTDRPVRSDPPHLPETESVPPRRTHAITRGGACAAALRRIAEHPCRRTNREIPTTSDRQAAASGFSPVEPEQPAPEGAHPLSTGRAPKNLAARLFPLSTEHKPAAGVPGRQRRPPETLRGPIPSAGRQAANTVRTRTRSSAAEQKNFDKNVRPIRRFTPSHRPRPCASSVRTVLTHAAAIRCIRVVAPSGKGTKQRLRDKPPLLSGSAYSEKIPRKRGRRGGKNKKRLSKTHQTASFGKRVPLISSRSDVFSSATDSNP